eukprot:CAMPEP_0117676986 /NCGR_PEP_ID=MMETSP0804-20121206/16504_1 /TAXON_ID=1074897 /ORGANISM="Tetraselmis astigmatica, Strain CCMP880" /LENGTH=77 /DNA_ID=CAMNT_0005486239 /DNA_START=768 /DNA_END=1001 /DNA_ORIENTATION=-
MRPPPEGLAMSCGDVLWFPWGGHSDPGAFHPDVRCHPLQPQNLLVPSTALLQAVGEGRGDATMALRQRCLGRSTEGN